MTTAKKYRLKFTVVGMHSEEVIEPMSALSYGWRSKSGNVHFEWSKEIVENNPEYFELVNEGVQIDDILYQTHNGPTIIVELSKPIPEDKLPLIKLAISKCINEVEEKCLFDVVAINKRLEELKDCKWVKHKEKGTVRFVSKRLTSRSFYDDGIISGQSHCTCNTFDYEDCTPEETVKHWVDYIYRQPLQLYQSEPTFTLSQLNEEQI